ncbi:unnamed protein product [Sympodiomycopsis kandeliae]
MLRTTIAGPSTRSAVTTAVARVAVAARPVASSSHCTLQPHHCVHNAHNATRYLSSSTGQRSQSQSQSQPRPSSNHPTTSASTQAMVAIAKAQTKRTLKAERKLAKKRRAQERAKKRAGAASAPTPTQAPPASNGKQKQASQPSSASASGFGVDFDQAHPSSSQGGNSTRRARRSGMASYLAEPQSSTPSPYLSGVGTSRSSAQNYTAMKNAPQPMLVLRHDDQIKAERRLRDQHEQHKSESRQQDSESTLKPLEQGKLASDQIPFTPVAPLREMNVATLAHGLDRVLFNPGVHLVKDPRTDIYNYDPTFNKIPDVDLFDFQALTPYITSSQDKELLQLAKDHNARFCGSTSSLTGMLSHVYFLVSGWRMPDFSAYTEPFKNEMKTFSEGARIPTSIVLRPQPDSPTYAIDADKDATAASANSNYVLAQLGKSMEKMMTVSPEEFETYLRVNRQSSSDGGGNVQANEEQGPEPEAYHYAKAGNSFLMRSQLDCSDDRLPGKTFDLKSRAVVTIRSDRANWVEASGYQIKHLTGLWESFERERYDMTRSAFLKYYLQAKIGCMDGIFVAYHNAARVFGFEYFPIEEMAKQIFGSVEMADQAFRLSVGLSEQILERVLQECPHPDQNVHLTFATSEVQSTGKGTVENPNLMRVFIEQSKKDGEGKTLSMMDVTVDRYINGMLVQGPVDFQSQELQDILEDQRPKHATDGQATSMEPKLEIAYNVTPRSDLSTSTLEEIFTEIKTKQNDLTQLVMPNISAVNDRELKLQYELSKNPSALERYSLEKKMGIASGLPRAPGQIELFIDHDKNTEESYSFGEQEKEVGEREYKWRQPSKRIDTLRQMSRDGAMALRKQRKQGQGQEVRMYVPRS